jgi:hypothetical protein
LPNDFSHDNDVFRSRVTRHRSSRNRSAIRIGSVDEYLKVPRSPATERLAEPTRNNECNRDVIPIDCRSSLVVTRGLHTTHESTVREDPCKVMTTGRGSIVIDNDRRNAINVKIDSKAENPKL